MNPTEHILLRGTDDPGMFLFWCPGCKGAHGVWTNQPNARTGAKWSFNGDMEKPTFDPSILVNGTKFTAKGERDYQAWREGNGPTPERFDSVNTVCHSFVRNGMIEFLGDCTHDLRGKTVPLEPF
jgi:hypothetical protein